MRVIPPSIPSHFVLISLIWATTPALNAQANVLSDCTNTNNPRNIRVQNCTKLIDDSTSSERVKITALVSRGGAQASADAQLARVDLDQALKSYKKTFFPNTDQRLVSSSQAASFKANGSPLTNIEWAEAFNIRGDVEADALNFNAAIDYYKEAARINPWNDSYESSLGISYSKRSIYAEAIKHLNRAVELNTNSAYNHLQRALVFRESGDRPNAKSDFEQAVRLYEADIARIQARAKATGQTPNSLKIYYTRLGDANLGADHIESAINDFQYALEARSDYELAFSGLGHAYILKGRYDLAVQNLSTAITLHPKDALAYAYRGQAYAESARLRRERKLPLEGQQLDLVRAQEDLKRALYLDPSLVDAHANFNDVNTALAQVNAEMTQSVTTDKPLPPQTHSPPAADGGEFQLPTTVVPTVAPERRLAFSVGNDSYPYFKTPTNPQRGQLNSPVYDAREIRDALKKLHFEVTERENLQHDDYVTEYANFAAQIQPGNTVLIYFSGHGAAIRGNNLFLPTDTPLLDPDSGADTLLTIGIAQFDLVKQAQEKGAKLVIVISDACREDPFSSARRVKSAVANRDSSMNPTPVSGALMIYAAGQGQTALDGSTPTEHSLFTKHLLPQLLKKNKDIANEFQDTKEYVAKEASPHQQYPAIYDETLGGRIFLNGAPPAQAQVEALGSNNSELAMKSLPTAASGGSDKVLAPQ